MDHINYNSPYYTPAHNHYYWEPQLPPSIQIHPQSAAGQLGYTPEQLAPILREQQQFLLAEELAQPPRVLTRPTTTSYHRTTRIEATPNPVLYARPQQEAAKLGISLEELAAISEQAIRDQAEWLTKDEAEWKNREGERWRGGQGADRENREGKRRGDGGDGETRTTRARHETSAHPPRHTPSIRIPTSRTPAVGNRPARADPRGGRGGPLRVHPRSGRDTKGDRGGGTDQTRTKGRAGCTRTRPTTGAPHIRHGEPRRHARRVV